MIFYLSYFIQSERVHNIIISLILIFIMICKYVKSNLNLLKKKSSIYFILFPTLITVAHILAQKQTSIYVCTYFVYKHSRITKEKKQVMVHFCVDFCLNLSDKQIFFDFTIALSIGN